MLPKASFTHGRATASLRLCTGDHALEGVMPDYAVVGGMPMSIDFIESFVKILFRATVEELRLDLGFVDFRNGYVAEFVKSLVAYLAVEHDLSG